MECCVDKGRRTFVFLIKLCPTKPNISYPPLAWRAITPKQKVCAGRDYPSFLSLALGAPSTLGGRHQAPPHAIPESTLTDLVGIRPKRLPDPGSRSRDWILCCLFTRLMTRWRYGENSKSNSLAVLYYAPFSR